MKILVADDSKTGREMLTSALTSLGHDVVCASNAEHAIAQFRKERPDFVVLNVVMDSISGFECTKALRKMDREHWTPIIFLSASVDDDRVAQGIGAGGDDYLIKPVSHIALAAKLHIMQRIVDVQKKLLETTCELSLLSSTDVLTGIDNRMQFNKSVKLQLTYAIRNQTQFALLLLDLDHFKEVNDNLSHQMGDVLLKEVTVRLKGCIRVNDCLARLGGDEFAIILSRINHPKDATIVAQKILDALKPTYHLAHHRIHISCSIGIACYPSSGESSDVLVQRADVAMYYAKELGRNNFQPYSEEYQAKHNQRYFLESALRFAIENNELFMCYQPIYHLRTRKIVGMEALMRWRNPTLGLVAPEVFIPIAEDLGLITTIGKWAFHQVCEQAQKWRNEGFKKLKLAVNISSQQLLERDLLRFIVNTLDETQFPPQLLEFELTESTVMSASTCIEKIIKDIASMKISVSLDDFGTGYSSLSHLKTFPITTLKIDKSFVLDITTNANDALIVQAIIALCKTLKLKVIAEGIETDAQLQFLIDNKCQEGQGYYLSKPLTADDMHALLHRERLPIKGFNP